MDAVWDVRSDVSRDEVGCWVGVLVHRRGNFRGKCGAPHCNHWGVCSRAVQKCVNHWSCSFSVQSILDSDYCKLQILEISQHLMKLWARVLADHVHCLFIYLQKEVEKIAKGMSKGAEVCTRMLCLCFAGTGIYDY